MGHKRKSKKKKHTVVQLPVAPPSTLAALGRLVVQPLTVSNGQDFALCRDEPGNPIIAVSPGIAGYTRYNTDHVHLQTLADQHNASLDSTTVDPIVGHDSTVEEALRGLRTIAGFALDDGDSDTYRCINELVDTIRTCIAQQWVPRDPRSIVNQTQHLWQQNSQGLLERIVDPLWYDQHGFELTPSPGHACVIEENVRRLEQQQAVAPVARVHVQLLSDGLRADLQVLDATRMQESHSPVLLYLREDQRVQALEDEIILLKTIHAAQMHEASMAMDVRIQQSREDKLDDIYEWSHVNSNHLTDGFFVRMAGLIMQLGGTTHADRTSRRARKLRTHRGQST